MEKLRTRWRNFFSVVFDPFIIFLIALTGLLTVLVVKEADPTITALLTVLVTVFSGILGSNLNKKWDDISGEKIIVARGKSAIRSLKLLMGQVVSLERRTRHFICNTDCPKEEIEKKDDLNSLYLEEIVTQIVQIEEGIISSIESWTDITPEGDIKTHIGLITDLNNDLDAKTKEAELLAQRLKETTGKSEKDIKKLIEEKRLKDEEIMKVKRELAEKSLDFGMPLSFIDDNSTGIITTHGVIHPSYVTQTHINTGVCRNCGNIFVKSNMYSTEELCNDCITKPTL